MNLFKKKQDVSSPYALVQTARSKEQRTSDLSGYLSTSEFSSSLAPQIKLYNSLREAVPIIDAAILKIIRLIGGYKLTCEDKQAELVLNHFVENVKVGSSSVGLESFICAYLDSLLMYGNAVGEIVLDSQNRQIMGLYNGSLSDIEVKAGADPLSADIFIKQGEDKLSPIKNRDLICFTALNPKSSEIMGNSILKGLPFVTSVLLRIYESIGQNFERIGNLRYAVTYKPSGDSLDKAYAKERAMQIAKEWSDGMAASKNGNVTDFISVGDVSIKVIGADNQMIDTQLPVRQMLEQIVAKLSIPPFLLGLSWSSTERMSKQQADILTSELEYYRRLLTPLILKVCRIFLRLNGFTDTPELSWNVISFQDESELARASLYRAQAEKILSEIGEGT